MRAAPLATALVLAALCGIGCGAGSGSSSAKTGTAPRAAAPGTEAAFATACGDLKARLTGIANRRGARDPLRGVPERRVVTEMRQASAESIAVSREIKAELRKAGAPTASIQALSRANRSYRRYARAIGRASHANDSGIHLQIQLLTLQDSELRAVCVTPAK
ncbi:MAG TPA: hypothetical protein VNV44_10475 [Solirubrobacteraceae bacterium]|jgi:hypothetical protein|nr:hypothetical protein [Solirubrobacteraceae bacterium]